MTKLKTWGLQQILNGLIRNNKIQETDRIWERNKCDRILKGSLPNITFWGAWRQWTYTGRKQDGKRKWRVNVPIKNKMRIESRNWRNLWS